jgi:hypothetical protein
MAITHDLIGGKLHVYKREHSGHWRKRRGDDGADLI